MSLYRAYFVPYGIDSSGTCQELEPCKNKIVVTSPEIIELRKKILKAGCVLPKILCYENCKKTGVFDFRTNTIVFCRNKIPKEHDNEESIQDLLLHEHIHAWDNCYGIDWTKDVQVPGIDCEKRICSEIRAYSIMNTKVFCNNPGFSERLRKNCIIKVVWESIKRSKCGSRRHYGPASPTMDRLMKKCYFRKGNPLPKWPFDPVLKPKVPLPDPPNIDFPK